MGILSISFLHLGPSDTGLMNWVGNLQPTSMTRDEVSEHVPTINVVSPDAVSSRRRKKVVTFASLADLAEIHALAVCEADSQALETGNTGGSEDAKPQALPDPSYFLNMPLEDYDAASNNVSKENVRFGTN